jgi:hypothetical protein
MDPYYFKRDQLFVSPSISDTMKTSAYYSPIRDTAYQNRSNIAELVGTWHFRCFEGDLCGSMTHTVLTRHDGE